MKRPIECESVAEFLTVELSRRKHRNKSYSLRAFARDLGLSPSRLSEIIKSQEGLSERNIDKVADNLDLKARERQYFKDLVLAGSARNEQVRELARGRLADARKAESHRRLKEDQFRAISDWYHAAILELTQLREFQPDSKWIAQRLGIAASQAEDAVERLVQLGLLEIKGGVWRTHPEAYSAFSETPSSAIRKFHRQVLSLATESVIEDPLEDRELVAMIVAIPKARMDEFRSDMKKFVSQFWERIEKDPKDDLYALSLQLCPVRNRRRGKTPV